MTVSNRGSVMSDAIDVEGLHAAREQAGCAKRRDAKAAKLRERRDSTATEDYEHVETEGTRKAHVRGNNLLRLNVALSTVLLKTPQYFNSMSEADKTGFTKRTFKHLNNDPQGNPFSSADQVYKYLQTSHTSNGKTILQVNEEKGRLEQSLKLEQEKNGRLEGENRRLLEALKSNQDFSKCQENQLKAKLNAAEIEKAKMSRQYEEELARQSELQESHANQQQENDRLKLELKILSEDAAKQILSLEDQLERHQENANKAKEDAAKQIHSLEDQLERHQQENANKANQLQWHRENANKAKETAEGKHFLTAKGVWKLLQKDFENMSIASIKKSLSEIMSQAKQESPFLNVLE